VTDECKCGQGPIQKVTAHLIACALSEAAALSLTSPTERARRAAYQASSLLFKATMCFVCPPDAALAQQSTLEGKTRWVCLLAYGGVKTEMSCNKQLAAFSEGGHPLSRYSPHRSSRLGMRKIIDFVSVHYQLCFLVK
jgi:hypothetical protein